MDELKKAQEKIAKLLNMTVANGATEDEQANAMRLAAGIAARMGIELEACRPKDQAKPKIKQKHSSVMMKVYESYCAEAAAILYGVECHAPNFGKHGFYYTGREENIDLAEKTMLWLIRQVELLYKQHLPRGLSVRDRAEFRASFKDACGQRVYNRAVDLIRQMKTNEQAARAATGHNALVVASHFDMLRQEIRDHYSAENKALAKRIADREKAQADHRVAMLAAMSEADRVKHLAEEQREKDRRQKEYDRWARKQANKEYKPPRHRNMKIGSGTGIGRQAGDAVKLREDLK